MTLLLSKGSLRPKRPKLFGVQMVCQPEASIVFHSPPEEVPLDIPDLFDDGFGAASTKNR